MPTKSKSDFGKGVLYYPVRQMGKAVADTYAPVPTRYSTVGMSGNEIPTWDKNAFKKTPRLQGFSTKHYRIYHQFYRKSNLIITTIMNNVHKTNL